MRNRYRAQLALAGRFILWDTENVLDKSLVMKRHSCGADMAENIRENVDC